VEAVEQALALAVEPAQPLKAVTKLPTLGVSLVVGVATVVRAVVCAAGVVAPAGSTRAAAMVAARRVRERRAGTNGLL